MAGLLLRASCSRVRLHVDQSSSTLFAAISFANSGSARLLSLVPVPGKRDA